MIFKKKTTSVASPGLIALAATLLFNINSASATTYDFKDYTGVKQDDIERIDKLEDEDKKVLFDTLQKPVFRNARVIIVEEEYDINEVINDNKNFSKGMILLLMGQSYQISDNVDLYYSTAIIGTVSDFDEAYYGDDPTTLKVSRSDLLRRDVERKDKVDSTSKPLFKFNNKDSTLYLNNIEPERSYNHRYDGHGPLIEIDSAREVMVFNNTLMSDDHHSLVSVACGANSGVTNLNIVNNAFDLNKYDSVGVHVTCDRPHLFRATARSNNFEMLHDSGSFPLKPSTAANTTNTTIYKHQDHHEPAFHDAPMSFVAAGKAELSFRDSICNSMYYFVNGEYFEDDTVPNHGLGLLDDAAIRDGAFVLSFTAAQAVAYTPCGLKLFHPHGDCPSGDEYAAEPASRYFPDSSIYNVTTHQCSAYQSAIFEKSADTFRDKSSNGFSPGVLIGMFVGGVVATVATVFAIKYSVSALKRRGSHPRSFSNAYTSQSSLNP